MASHPPIGICLVTGCTGAGKTTLIEKAQAAAPGARTAVLGVDARSMAELPDDLTALAEGGGLDSIFLEADPAVDLPRLIEMLTMVCEVNTEDGLPMKFDNVAAVVDCDAAVRAFSEGRLLNRPPLTGADEECQIIDQLELASTVVFNRADVIPDRDLDELIATARLLQPDAAMALVEDGTVPPEEFLHTGRYEHDRLMKSAGWVNILQNPEDAVNEEDGGEYGLTTFLYVRRQPFIHEKLVELCDYWPHSVIRAKGMVWYREEPEMSFIFEQAGRRITESPSGKFLAAAPKEEQLRIIGKHPEIRRLWHPQYGDRMIKLAFITKKADQELLTYRLDECLGDL